MADIARKAVFASLEIDDATSSVWEKFGKVKDHQNSSCSDEENKQTKIIVFQLSFKWIFSFSYWVFCHSIIPRVKNLKNRTFPSKLKTVV